MTTDFSAYRARVDKTLQRHLASLVSPPRLRDAMAYSVFNGGKRIRPILVYLAAEAVGASLNDADEAAAAVEMIHAYSLVHDDLPCMDDDTLRRGNPTCHIQFDEATAVLAADALQACAFNVITRAQHLPAGTRISLIDEIGRAAGAEGMVAGQMLDLGAEGTRVDEATLREMHRHKTGALLRASVRMGALLGDPDDNTLALLTHFGEVLGLAFQVRDDILDETGDAAVMGKAAGSDRDNDKATFTTILGLDVTREILADLRAEALKAIAPLHNASQGLRDLTHFVIDRDH